MRQYGAQERRHYLYIRTILKETRRSRPRCAPSSEGLLHSIIQCPIPTNTSVLVAYAACHRLAPGMQHFLDVNSNEHTLSARMCSREGLQGLDGRCPAIVYSDSGVSSYQQKQLQPAGSRRARSHGARITCIAGLYIISFSLQTLQTCIYVPEVSQHLM